ncbi:MAG: methyltransferase domain-containing protein [Pseudomonadota bacterium]
MRLLNRLRRMLRPGPDGKRYKAFKSALKWVRTNRVTGKGVVAFHDQARTAYPEVTGYFIPTLLECGEHDLALEFASWLLSIQNPDGSWSDAGGKAPYVFDTGQVLKGLVAVMTRMPECEPAVRRGCEWMLGRMEPSGRLVTPDKRAWVLPDGRSIPEKIHIYSIQPLRDAGLILDEQRYAAASERALSYHLSDPSLTEFDTLSHFHAYVIEGLLDLGRHDLAAAAMDHVESRQRPDGGIPAYNSVDWVCSPGTAQFAVVWYRLGRLSHAVRALDYLCDHRNRSGGFFGSFGPGANYLPRREISWTVKFFLDAFCLHVRTAFDPAQDAVYPNTVDPDDGRLQALFDSLEDLSGRRVLDAGCGKGRFAGTLRERFPGAEFFGLDISDAMLERVPPGIRTTQGTLTDIPFQDALFDAVYCIEALEHALNPRTAVGELCRIIKPGGRIVIIDKNADFRDTMRTEAWETWFGRVELEQWLGDYCTDVKSRFIPLRKGTAADGFFLAWTGVRL